MNERKYIFIVDDDRDDREMIRDAFISILPQYEYVLLEDGDKLFEHLEVNYDQYQSILILLDLNMPGKDGRLMLKEIKSENRYFTIPILIFTTSSSFRDKKLAYEMEQIASSANPSY
jgi:CheY-like chemotaxis protein